MNRAHIGSARDQQRPQIIVLAVNEGQNGDGGKDRNRQRQHEFVENLKKVGAVYNRIFFQVFRETDEGLNSEGHLLNTKR